MTRFTLVYGLASKANLHRADCTCVGRQTGALLAASRPLPQSFDAPTFVDALQSPIVTKAARTGYRVILSKCARNRR